MKLALFVLLSTLAVGQVVIEPKTVILGKTFLGGIPAAGTSITVAAGGSTKGNNDDSGDSGAPLESTFVTGSVAPTFDGKAHHYFNTTTNVVRGAALYSDNADSPDAGTLICSMTVTSNPGTGWGTLQMTGCPGTLSANTQYHIAYGSQDNSELMGTSGVNDRCPYSGWPSTQSTINLGTGWTGTWAGNSDIKWKGGNGCYTTYVELTYSSLAAYNIIAVNPGGCDVANGICITKIAPIGSGHGLLVAATPSSASFAPSSVVTTTNGTTTDTLTKIGTCSTVGRHWCFYWIDRATAGSDGVTCTFTSSGADKLQCVSIEIQGTISSGSQDQVEYDGSATNAAAFTSGSITTGQQELIIGYDQDDNVPNAQNTTDNIAAGSGWTYILSGMNMGNSPGQFLIEMRISGAGTYNATGTANCCAATNTHWPGMISLK